MDSSPNCKYVIFGAGGAGKEALRHFGRDRVAYFCDNNPEKIGQYIEGIRCISYKELVSICKAYTIIITVIRKDLVVRQFQKDGIENFLFYERDADKGLAKRNGKTLIVKNDDKIGKMMERLNAQCGLETPIREYEEFREMVVECRKELCGQYAFYDHEYDETVMYGHADALMRYAGIETDYGNFPKVAHGIFFSGLHPAFKSAAIFGGGYDKKIHNLRYPYIPAFTVGSYIQYADSIYSEDRIAGLKEKNGRTALVFLVHTAEQTGVKYDESAIVKAVAGKYIETYKTVYICAYWNDIDKGIYETLRRAGAKIVSAGFRWDTRFIDRLKTLFILADDVVVYGMTSAAPYALSLNKNLHLINIEETILNGNLPSYIPADRIESQPDYLRAVNILYQHFGEKKKPVPDNDWRFLCTCFGLDLKRTREEIRMMYQICCDIWQQCGNNPRDYPIGVYKAYQMYQDQYDIDKLSMLSQAVGKGFINI